MKKERILFALNSLGVKCAGRQDDPFRWSVEDLATDLAEAINGSGMEKAEILEFLKSGPKRSSEIEKRFCPEGVCYSEFMPGYAWMASNHREPFKEMVAAGEIWFGVDKGIPTYATPGNLPAGVERMN